MVITRFISKCLVNEFAVGVRCSKYTLHSNTHSKNTIRKIFKGLFEKVIIVCTWFS